jgi:glycosyltransferase involved in cell wall biosynthesis
MTADAPSGRRLRLLLLLPHVPNRAATTGGARATGHLIAGLAVHHDLAVLALRFAADSTDQDTDLRAQCAVFETIEPRQEGNRWWRAARRSVLPLISTPAWVLAAAAPAYQARVRTLSSEWRPDLVHVFYHVMAQYLPQLDDCVVPRILTQYEPGAAAALESARDTRGWAYRRRRLEARAWERYERQIVRQFDTVIVLTERDRLALAPWAGSAPLVRVPLGVPIPPVALDPAGAEARSVLFVGNFIHPPNVDAATWLMQSIFPGISRARPDVRLLIVGPQPSREMTAMAGGQVTVIGGVDDVTPFLNRASVVVAPLRRGGGMRVKVMEALAAGKAVVATPLAVEGLDVTAGHEVLIADEASDFTAAIGALLDDREMREQLGRRAREWGCRHLGWASAVSAYEGVQAGLLTGSPPG